MQSLTLSTQNLKLLDFFAGEKALYNYWRSYLSSLIPFDAYVTRQLCFLHAGSQNQHACAPKISYIRSFDLRSLVDWRQGNIMISLTGRRRTI